jgi:hypothetical protein
MPPPRAEQRDELPPSYVEHGDLLPDAVSAPPTGPCSVFRTFSLPHINGQVLGADLNRSESSGVARTPYRQKCLTRSGASSPVARGGMPKAYSRALPSRDGEATGWSITKVIAPVRPHSRGSKPIQSSDEYPPDHHQLARDDDGAAPIACSSEAEDSVRRRLPS